jgi:hypothetical protein
MSSIDYGAVGLAVRSSRCCKYGGDSFLGGDQSV